MKSAAVSIIGAGPTGALLAIFLRRRGFEVTLYERRTDPRSNAGESGRSINLALADRGIHALRAAGAFERLRPGLIPMRGRMIHDLNGSTTLQPYGQSEHESIYSISRHRLNQVLIDIALGLGAKACFEHELVDIDPDRRRISVLELRGGARNSAGGDRPGPRREIETPVLFGADGAGSRVRHLLAEQGRITVHEAALDHGYKELSLPADHAGQFAMMREALHIWPRQDHMLIALPNGDASFTATLFLPRTGTLSFASLQSRQAAKGFIDADFPDAACLMPRAGDEFLTHPTGFLGTVYAEHWYCHDWALLIGDAAHAIVPFHGQGMNCCFEDCVELDALIDTHASWGELFAAFQSQRRPNTDAIAAMALENYLEMRERVADQRFQLQKALSLELERRFPQHFVPRYSMVSFRHEIPYALAAARGASQQAILDELTLSAASMQQIDFDAAQRLILTRLAPLDAAITAANRPTRTDRA